MALINNAVRESDAFLTVRQIQPHAVEERVVNNFTHTDVFNDLSVHWFPPERLRQLPPDTWSRADEPTYDSSDVEIILQTG